MSGFFWHVFTFTAVFIFFVLAVYRVVAIIRMPVHLRWELAPIPHEKGKSKYGGSYLEDFEWWRKPRRRSLLGPIIYMLKEIFLFKGVWKNNRSFWPFALLLHVGIYLFVITVLLNILNAVFIATGVPAPVLNVFFGITSVVALAGFLAGTVGSISMIIKRSIDADYRPFTTPLMYFKLGFLAAVFVTGIWAWSATPAYASTTGRFVRDLFTLDGGIGAAAPLATNIIISLLFIAYLPLTDMLHFITKYFTHHAVRWNDEPVDGKMDKKLVDLITEPVRWGAPHVGSGKSWGEIASGKVKDGKKT